MPSATNSFRFNLSRACLLTLAAIFHLAPQIWASDPEQEADPPEVKLGERLFMDTRFSSPAGSNRISCRKCHLVDEEKERGIRAYVDYDARSIIPHREGDEYAVELRNSPTMLDSAFMPLLHWDGEFTSLEQLTKTTLSHRNMGWLEGEQETAFDQAYRVLLEDRGGDEEFPGTYEEQFRSVYGVEIKNVSRDGAIDWIARSMSDYMRSLRMTYTSPYDEFIKANQLEDGPVAGEDPKTYAKRHLLRVLQREKAGTLKLPKDFDGEALAGFKIFFATEGEAKTGHCIVCHVPPAFTDFSFHNIGVVQAEYDSLHGEASFAELEIPGASSPRPNEKLRSIPAAKDPRLADLGHWNFVNLKTSPLRRESEPDDAFLSRMIATFKTPTLRNLKFTDPYLHTGSAKTVEDALKEIVELSALARASKIRSGDEEFTKVNVGKDEIAPLTAFLKSLNEVYE